MAVFADYKVKKRCVNLSQLECVDQSKKSLILKSPLIVLP